MSDLLPWCICCGRTRAICKRDKGCSGIDPTKPSESFKAAYYAGGHRMIIGGCPVRVAAYVKDWAPWMKRALGKGTMKDGPYEWSMGPEARETRKQYLALMLAPRIGEIAKACQLEPAKPLPRRISARSEARRQRNRQFFMEQRQCA